MSDNHEPPFDGSPACAMCPMEWRNLSAVVHNYLQDGNDRDDVVRAVKACSALVTADTAPQLVALLEAAELHGFWYDRVLASPNAEASEFARHRMWHYHTEMRVAEDAVSPLSDAHFADSMHSHGRIL